MAARNKYLTTGGRRRVWRRWGAVARTVFNETFETMRDNQRIFLHPHAEKIPARFWRTVAFNAAWIAADAVR